MKQFDNLGVLRLNTGYYSTRLNSRFTGRKPYKTEDHRMVLSFIPGTIKDIIAKPGQMVNRGDDLIILDAMKMQNRIKSKMDGKVKKILVSKGDKVSKGMVLLEIE